MTFQTQSKNHHKRKRDIGRHILDGLNFNIKQRETSKVTHPTIFYFIFTSLTLPNNKISDTTKKSVHIFTGEQVGHRNSECQLLRAQDTDR